MAEGEDDSRLAEVRGWRKVIRFTLPTIISILFISSYTVIDGAFISNFVGTNALAAINLLMPVASLLSGFGFMFATGGSAYVANLLGQRKGDQARAAFSQITLAVIIISLLITAAGLLFMGDLVDLLGADSLLHPLSAEYGTVYVTFTVFLILQFVFTQFLVVAGRPGMSLAVSIAGGVTNIVLDYLLIVVLDMGLTGAAIASSLGSMVPVVASLYVFLNKDSSVHFVHPSKGGEAVVRSCTNGISEMVSELSGGITILCYNLVMMDNLGADGVSAITILSYVQFLSLSTIIGYSNGVAPVMSYNHGAGNHQGMQELLRISTVFVMSVSLVIFVLLELFVPYIAGFFASSSEAVMEIAVNGAVIYSFGFLFIGMNVYASSLFTSLSNGLVSAVVSALHSLVLLSPMILLLPYLFGIGAVWYAMPLAQFVTFLVSMTLIIKYNGKYGYLPTCG